MLRGLLLACTGVAVGVLIGNVVAGSRLSSASVVPAPYARLSANPDAAAAPSIDADPCVGCPDSYGVAARLRAERENRMDKAFRALGSVESDAAASHDEDDYRYGGGFPNLPPRTTEPAVSRPDTAPDTSDMQLMGPDPSAEVP